jgi:hypothetical protein
VRRELRRFSEENGRKDARAAVIDRRNEGLVERLWNKYALKGGNYMQSSGTKGTGEQGTKKTAT